jgi:hypothetical protein
MAEKSGGKQQARGDDRSPEEDINPGKEPVFVRDVLEPGDGVD